MAQRATTLEVLNNFSSLPDSGKIRLPVVQALLGVSSSTIWRMAKAKKLTAYKLTPRTTTFSVGEIRQILEG